MKKSKLFLSGPMSGYPEWNHPTFHEAAATLRALGFKVFNPAESYNGDTTRPRSDYMRVCLEALLKCDGLVSLPRWSSSEGAYIERKAAEQIGLPVWNLASFLKEHS